MRRRQRTKLLTFALIGMLLTGSFGVAASAAEAGAAVPGESFAMSGEPAEAGASGDEADGTGTDSGRTGNEAGGTGTDSGRTGDEAGRTGADSGRTPEESAEDSAPAASDAEAGGADTDSGRTGDEAGRTGDEAGRAPEESAEDRAPAESDAEAGGTGAGGSADEAGRTGADSGRTPEESAEDSVPAESDAETGGAGAEAGGSDADAGGSDADAGIETDAEAGQTESGEQSGSGALPADGSQPGGQDPAGDIELPNELEAMVTMEYELAALGTVEEKPQITVLGSPASADWKDTTTLFWDAVEHADRYRITVYLRKAALKYSKVLYVTGKTEYDLEDEIVALIKANRKAITGASYTVSATVQAQSTDTAHYTNGKATPAPSFRYLRTTYLEALERNGWYSRNGNWYYYEAGVVQTGWLSFGGERYFLNKDGVMLKSRWYSGKYLKSDGAMARNEWVDNYKYYVGQDGNVTDTVKFSGKNWVQTKAGWRYKKADGKFVKNTWYPIGHRMYYFDASGHMVTGWLKLDGNTYYLKNSGDIMAGRGTRQTGWLQIGSSHYWFDKNGVMLKNQWVDKGQYYVGAAGKRQSWISYAALRNVNTSNRLGYDIYSRTSAPEQSIPAYDQAYLNGNRILVIDLRFTKDNVPVCFHDDMIGYARLPDGKEPAVKPTISAMTYSELCKYDYGIYRGAQYQGTAPLTLGMMAAWIRRHSDAELYIEVKANTMTAAQIQSLVSVISANGIVNQCSTIFTVATANDTRAKRVHRLLPTMRIGITTSQLGTLTYSQLDQVKDSCETFVWGWNTTTLSASAVSRLKSSNVLFESGVFTNDFENILAYYSRGSSHAYNSGVETPGVVFKSLLSAATYHDKAQWVSTDKGWKYQKVDKSFVKNCWLTLDGKKYYLNANGIMQTGWLSLSGKMYYLENDGTMVTGWKYVGTKRYYFNGSGVMLTGIQVLNGHTYQFTANGVFVKKIR